MLFLIGCNGFISNEYVAFVSRNTESEEIHNNIPTNMIRRVVESINSGNSIGKAFRSVYNTTVASIVPEDRSVVKVKFGLLDIFGPPETTLRDLIEEPKVIIQPNINSGQEYIIEIPKGKFSVDFIIKNVGKIDVNYSFNKSDIIGIDPIVGVIPVGNETKINLKVLNKSTINIQSNDDIETTLKPKSTKIYFKSNAGDKELLVKYWDI